MSSQGAVRWSGLAGVLSALFIFAGSLAQVMLTDSATVSVTLLNVGLLLVIFALTGVSTRLLDEVGLSGFLAYVAAVVGVVLRIADGIVKAYVFPILDESAVSVLQASAWLDLVEGLGGFAFLLGLLLLALSGARSSELPQWAGWLVFFGTLLGSTGSLALMTEPSDLIFLLGRAIMVAGLFWYGLALLRPKPEEEGNSAG